MAGGRQQSSGPFSLVLTSASSRPVALTASPKAPARPLVVPSKDYSHGGGLAAPLFREGRQAEDDQQSTKKRP